MSFYGTQWQGLCHKSKGKEHDTVYWGINKKETQENRKASSFLRSFGTGVHALELDGDMCSGSLVSQW